MSEPIKPQAHHYSQDLLQPGIIYPCVEPADFGNPDKPIKPKYQPGETVYLKETWRYFDDLCSCYEPAACQCPSPDSPIYLAQGYDKEAFGPWKPAMLMPEKASRQKLLIVSVRAERLQEITHADAIAEGCQALREWDLGREDVEPPREQFQALWDSIYGKTFPWDSNPWVFRYEFKRVEA